MTKGKSGPLWLRAIKEPAAKAWLKKHQEEFPTESFLPDPVSYKDKIVLAREKVASIIADCMPYDDPEQQRLAELVLSCTPRIIAKKLRISRREVYLRIRALKRAAIRIWRSKRDEAVMARSRKAPSTHEPLEGIALRTVKFTRAEKEQYAYEVQFKGGRTWLDGDGVRFTPDVQEILNHLEEYQISFESVEVYNGGQK